MALQSLGHMNTVYDFRVGARVLRTEMCVQCSSINKISVVGKKKTVNKHVNIFENLGETNKFLEILFIYMLLIYLLLVHN